VHGNVGALASIGDYLESLVHPSARADVLTVARHRAFIAPRLLGGIAALASLPLYLIARGIPSTVELLVFGWLVAPILMAYFLSRTGRFDAAHVLSSMALTCLVTVVAAATGGIGSFAAIWLVIVPIEAALSASRRVVIAASACALGAVVLLVLLGADHVLPRTGRQEALTTLGLVTALLYAAGLALGAEALVRTSLGLRHIEEDRYHLLARNMTDVITRHGTDGGVLFVSPAAESLFRAPAGTLHGQGLFERVHVADRPAYLGALGDAAALAETSAVELRVRRESMINDGRRDPHYLWIEMRCRPLERMVSGAVEDSRREVVAVLRDVSEWKRQRKALERSGPVAESANSDNTRLLAMRRAAPAADVQFDDSSSMTVPLAMRGEMPVRERA
jgi:two-component system, cell cycle sensor histidine kinase DivJ